MNTKKLIAGIAAAAMLAGCSSSSSSSSTAAATSSAAAETTAAAAATGALKVGVGSYTTISTSDASADGDGKITINTTFVGLALDDSNTVQYIWIDVAQNSGTFDTTGVITSDTEAATPTKKEKGDDYGMKDSSSIGKEWYEQAEGFEQWALGKTVDEIVNSGTETNDTGHVVSTDEDLLTTTTISVDAFQAAVQAAADNAVAVDGDIAQLGTGSNTVMSFTDASADGDGEIQASVTYGIWALDADGTVLYAQTDCAQNSGTFTTEGVANEATVLDTKEDLGDEYGMKSISPIGLEWYEQNEGFDAWCVGKTMDEIINSETTTGSEGSPVSADEDLLTTTTIAVNGFLGAADAANTNMEDVAA